MKPLLLLHGAIGSQTQLRTLADRLSSDYYVHSLNFRGHGGREEGEFSISAFAGDVLQWLKEKGLKKISIFGYSMGGYVAMYLASLHPEVVESVMTLGTKYHWDEAAADKETAMLNPEKIEAKLPAFAAQLNERHQPADWKAVLQNTAAMLRQMGANSPLKEEDFSRIAAPVLLLLGDRDKMVTLEETVAVYKQLSNASLGVLPRTPHPIEQADAEVLVFLVKRFLQ